MTTGTWFGTDFDMAPSYLRYPVELLGGQDPAVAITDQVARGTGIIGRVSGECGAVAVRVQAGAEPVRVSVDLRLDDTGTRWWADRVRPRRGQAERGRLVLLRSQGRLRTAVLLARRQGWLAGVAARERVEFDLPAADLAGDALLVIELADAAELPDWAADRLSTGGPTGVRIDRIAVQPASGGSVPGGSVPAAVRGSGSAFVVVPPGHPPGVWIRLLTERVPPAPPVPRTPGNRWTRRRPARAVAKLLRLLGRVAGRATAGVIGRWPRRRFAVRAVDLATGTPCPVRVRDHDRTGVRVALAGPVAGPVLLGLVPPGAPRWERTRWQLACRTATTPE